jgi:hypothetical protein
MDKCPVCKSDAERLEPGFFDGYTIKCPTHGEIEFSDTTRVTRWNEPREAWECALTKARDRALRTASTSRSLVSDQESLMMIFRSALFPSDSCSDRLVDSKSRCGTWIGWGVPA